MDTQSYDSSQQKKVKIYHGSDIGIMDLKVQPVNGISKTALLLLVNLTLLANSTHDSGILGLKPIKKKHDHKSGVCIT